MINNIMEEAIQVVNQDNGMTNVKEDENILPLKSHNIIRPKRSTRDKKPNRFLSDDYDKQYQRFSSRVPSSNGSHRRRNKAIKYHESNKWTVYRTKMQKLIALLARELHYIESYNTSITTSRKDNVIDVLFKELEESQHKANRLKLNILDLFHNISKELDGLHQWKELEMDIDDDGNVDLSNILCSVCHEDEVEGNDILLCDHKGCCRAYHQQCLDPPIQQSIDTPDGIEDDWFCWTCELLDDCLTWINEMLELDYENWYDLFPEVQFTHEKRYSFSQVADCADSESDDEDYIPLDDKDSTSSNTSDSETNENDSCWNDSDSDDVNDRNTVSDDKENDADELEYDSEYLEDDEVNLLLQEAEIPQSNEICYIKAGYNLRGKNIQVINVEPFDSIQDVGRRIAKSNKKYIILGTIVEYQRNDCGLSNWKVLFDDFDVIEDFDRERIRSVVISCVD